MDIEQEEEGELVVEGGPVVRVHLHEGINLDKVNHPETCDIDEANSIGQCNDYNCEDCEGAVVLVLVLVQAGFLV